MFVCARARKITNADVVCASPPSTRCIYRRPTRALPGHRHRVWRPRAKTGRACVPAVERLSGGTLRLGMLRCSALLSRLSSPPHAHPFASSSSHREVFAAARRETSAPHRQIILQSLTHTLAYEHTRAPFDKSPLRCPRAHAVYLSSSDERCYIVNVYKYIQICTSFCVESVCL